MTDTPLRVMTPVQARLHQLASTAPTRPAVAAQTAVPAVSPPRDTVGLSARSGRIPAQGVSLDVMTYNVWGRPAPLGRRNGERMAQIGTAIRGHGIVALQETFTRASRVIPGLGDFQSHQRGDDGGFFRLNSGLMTLSNYPILKTDFAEFKKAAHADLLAEKGVLFTRMNVPGVGPVDIYNTHYQAVDGDKYRKIRLHDNDVLASLIRKHDEGYPTFIMGDFNSRPDSPEYRDLMQQLPGLRDLYADAHPGDPGWTSAGSNSNNTSSDRGNRIDYIFYLPGKDVDLDIESVRVAMTERIDGRHPSDHYAVHGRVTLTPRPSHAPQQPTATAVTGQLRLSR